MRPMSPRFAPRELHSLFRDGVATGLTDRELLDRFANGRDSAGEIAFAALVARYGPMVMNVCRRMLRNSDDAEDAFQATFLVLVRRAGAIRFEASLGPWLYGVSVRVARRARNMRAPGCGRAGRCEGGSADPRETRVRIERCNSRSMMRCRGCRRTIARPSCSATCRA